MDHKVKSGVVREVYSNLLGHKQTNNKCLEKAAKKMVAKWSPLKDPLDPDNVSFPFFYINPLSYKTKVVVNYYISA